MIATRLTLLLFLCPVQVIGSSILIVYDSTHVGAWMIDFVKTLPLPDGVRVTHQLPWQQGNHEEGYLTGISNLIQVSDCHTICISSSFSFANLSSFTSEDYRRTE